MISAANTSYSTENTTYLTLDATSLTSPTTKLTLASHLPHPQTRFTKIFSNAALHWILRGLAPQHPNPDFTPLVDFFRACYDLLSPGGIFVSESGAHGNVGEVHAALVSALIHRGIPAAEARQASPWFFPSTKLMETVLTTAGFQVEVSEAEERPTEAIGGGVENWVRFFGAVFLDKVEEWVNNEREGGRGGDGGGEKGRQAREDVVKEVAEAVEVVGRRVEDGRFMFGYVRLRIKARKPESRE